MRVPRLALHLTDRCQLDCQHCLRDPSQKPRDLDFGLIDRITREASELYGIKEVGFTGGEPTLHPRFDAIVDLVVTRSMSWDMVSNGRAFPGILARLEAKPPRIAGLTAVTFSLDGSDERTHDSIRERGSFRDVMAAVAACAARRVPFGIQMAVHARNEHQLEAVGLLAAQLGAGYVSFPMTQATGTKHDAALFLPAAVLRRVRRRIEQLAGVLSVKIVVPSGHHEESAFTVCEPLAGETLHVDVEGRLTLCCLHAQVPSSRPGADVAGDLNDLSLVDAHRRLLELLRTTQEAALARLVTGPSDSWAGFPCNSCLASFGRPHWTDEGAAGPDAARARWRGVWQPGPHRHDLGAETEGETIAPRRLRLIDP